MNDLVIQFLLPALLAFVGGLAGTLIGPWMSWLAEKRKFQIEYKAQLIDKWRKELDNFEGGGRRINELASYSVIFGRLSERDRDVIRGNHIVVDGGLVTTPTEIFKRELAHLEIEWDLVDFSHRSRRRWWKPWTWNRG